MGATIRHGRTLRATLCEIERGVFYATYAGCEALADTEGLTRYQVGASAADAKRSIERGAHAFGYETVIWTETIVAPLFASHEKSALLEPATVEAAFQGVAGYSAGTYGP